MHNSFGDKIRISLYGASHAPQIGIRIEGVPQGLPLSLEDFEEDLARRRAGAKGTTARRESDIPNIISGVVNGVTTGEVVEITFANSDTRSHDYSQFKHHPRPSHVDLSARHKYGEEFDLRGGGIFSGRLTAVLVAAGVVAKKMIPEVKLSTRIVEIGGERDEERFAEVFETLSTGGLEIECFEEHFISGKLTASADRQTVLTTIPYDAGWHPLFGLSARRTPHPCGLSRRKLSLLPC